MTSNGHEISALTGAYALDALDAEERAAFETHLAHCEDCAAEVRSLRAAAGELSHTNSLDPPPALRASVLGAIEGIRPLPPTSGEVTSLHARRVPRWAWQAVAAACVLLAAAGGAWGYQQHQEAQHAQARAAAITRVLDSPDAATVAGSVGSTGRATIIYSETEHQIVVVGHDIAEPPGHKTYQLWMINMAGHATSAGLFTPDNAGKILVHAVGILPGTTHIGISVEPAGGSPQPTHGAIVADIPI